LALLAVCSRPGDGSFACHFAVFTLQDQTNLPANTYRIYVTG
jgi:hypothetical protein